MVNATENDALRSVWVCGPHQDDAIQHTGTLDDLAALTLSHLGTADNFTTIVGSHEGMRFVLLAKIYNNGERNAWHSHYCGPILCIVKRDTWLSLDTLRSIVDTSTPQ
jgi:hypothetical protein